MKISGKFLRSFLAAVVILIVGGIIGYVSAEIVPAFIYRQSSIRNGPWITNPHIGKQAADIYTRAVIARHGLLALDRTEAVYYTAETDSEGSSLQAGHDYVIKGEDLAAGWWSITAYCDDDFLIPNEKNRYSYTSTELEEGEGGSWQIRLSQSPKEGNWLPTGKEVDSFSLMLRLYKPDHEFYENPDIVELPRVVREEP